jgi:ATP-dependent Clp protease ATP-binding subunit ClpB
MNYLIRGEEKLKNTQNFKCVGRDTELKEMASILTRKTANSIVLTGPGGVGSTSLCLGLWAWKTQPDAPFDVAAKRIFWLDTDGLFSSSDDAIVNTEFHKIMTTLEMTTDSILIIEDYNDFLNAAKNGHDHFINALMNMVKTGASQVIFEVKDTHFDQAIKSHSDMLELFTVMDLAEPNDGPLHAIVKDTAESLATYHGIKVTEDAVNQAIALTNKYRSTMTRAQPSRSVSLLDRALATYKMTTHEKISDDDKQLLTKLTSELRRYEDARVQLVNDLETEDARLAESGDNQKNAIGTFSKMIGGGGIDNATKADIKNRLAIVDESVEKAQHNYEAQVQRINQNLALTGAEVTAEFSRISGIPADKLNEDEREKLRNLETNILGRIFGQDDAVKHVAGMVKTSRVGRRTRGRPMGACIFTGPSGVGKTEMAKALAVNLFGDEKSLFRLDMSEYMEKHAVAKLIGAPPGYEGFEAGGILTNSIRRQPVCVLLLDEIEKAHPDVFNIFLQILGDGRLTDNVGRVVSFEDTYVLCTTNIGQEYYLDKKLSMVQAQERTMAELDKNYRPEFLNRFGGRKDIIQFKALDLPTIERIVKRELNLIVSAYGVENITFEVDDNEVNKFCQKNYDPRTGARGLPGHLRSTLEPAIADVALEKNPEDTVNLSIVYDTKTTNLIVKKK